MESELKNENLVIDIIDDIDITTPIYFPCLLCCSLISCCCISTRDISSAICCRCCFPPPRPTWNHKFEIATSVVRNIIRTLPKKKGSISVIRAVGDGGIPYWSPLLPFGVRSSRGKSLNKVSLPAYEIVYPKSDGLPNLWHSIEDLTAISQTPQKTLNRKFILYFHGGGFIMGGRGSHRMVSHDLCKSTGATVILIEYKRAPEFKHPVAEIECFESYKWLIQRVDSSNIILAGDSAGGALVVNVLSLIKENQISYPRGAVLLSPWVDWFDFTSDSMKSNVCFDYIEPLAAKLTSKLYIETPVNYHSPTNKDFVGFPPILVEYGECEILHDQIKAFIDKATAAGVNVQSNCYPDMVHVFQVFNLTGMLACKQSYENINKFVTNLYEIV
uniref:Alpha/beta hydrolase fold-3 domain-containing protein n=1 Tax=Chromulina nebulosa TaxID=96789 RepID=A0A7S0SS94_9STRA|mmetsp:Transcript_2802/g.2465  ORF Transcript_2802/g.2465 Transcript_2802/m.2465 type:complete len:387 (+) Transcript_2802:1-1161(+)